MDQYKNLWQLSLNVTSSFKGGGEKTNKMKSHQAALMLVIADSEIRYTLLHRPLVSWAELRATMVLTYINKYMYICILLPSYPKLTILANKCH